MVEAGGFFMAVLSLRHFSPLEFRCKCGCGAGMEKMDADLLQMLDEARDLAGIPFPLSSAYRCPKHNKAVGGVPTSAHTRGYAVDTRVARSRAASNRNADARFAVRLLGRCW